jgi:hypothetical protein
MKVCEGLFVCPDAAEVACMGQAADGWCVSLQPTQHARPLLYFKKTSKHSCPVPIPSSPVAC